MARVLPTWPSGWVTDLTPLLPLFALAPVGVTILGALALVVLAVVGPSAHRLAFGIALAAPLGALPAVAGATRLALPVTGSGLVVDAFALFVQTVLALVAAVVVLLAFAELERLRPHAPEFFALILLATAGGMLAAAAVEMATLVVALELVAVCLYVLAGSWKRQSGATEAAFQYFAVGLSGTAVLVYGLAVLYGLTGHTDLAGVAVALRGASAPNARPTLALLVALALIMGGLAVKLGMLPFHAGLADVYIRAPLPVAGFLAAGATTAALAVFLRMLPATLGLFQASWAPMVAGLAAVTMTGATAVAMAQQDPKRVIAYATFAQLGYMLMAVLEPQGTGLGAALFLLLVSAFVVLAALGALAAGGESGGSTPSTYAGLAHHAPWPAVIFALAVMSLVGIPPLAGSIGKFLVLVSAARAGYAWLVLLALINTLLAAVTFVRVLKAIFLDEPGAMEPTRVERGQRLALLVCLLVVLGATLAAGPLVDLSNQGAAALIRS